MSASMSSTRAPPYASAMAILHAVVVLPSSGWALVTAINFVPSEVYFESSDVRSDRNDSPKSCGMWLDASSGWRSPRTDGTSPRNGIFSRSEEHTSELQSPYDLVCR